MSEQLSISNSFAVDGAKPVLKDESEDVVLKKEDASSSAVALTLDKNEDGLVEFTEDQLSSEINPEDPKKHPSVISAFQKIRELMGDPPEDTVETSEDENGNVTEVTTTYNKQGDPVRKTTSVHDKDGNLTSETVEQAGRKTETTYEYDENGNVTKQVSVKYDTDGNITSTETVTYKYDKDGNLENKVDELTDKNGKPTARYESKYENGLLKSETETEYDDGRLLKEVVTELVRDEEGLVIREIVTTTTYDHNNGEIQEQTVKSREVSRIKATKDNP